jgi:NAD(P)-dependent dehydrogenase (short-subunit alcohol dehydrogenase family)
MPSKSRQTRTALITGANRGIGFETAKQLAAQGWQVLAAARKAPFPAEQRLDLSTLNPRTEFLTLDITQIDSIENVVTQLHQSKRKLDLLINNAGILIDPNESILNVDPATLQNTFATNTIAPILLTRALVPFLEQSSDPLVLNLSSAAGSLADMRHWAPAYSLSKAALNAATRQLAIALAPKNISVCSVSPGWVRTDMGGPNATRSIEDAAKSIIALLDHPQKNLTSRFLRDGTDLPW